MKTAKRILALLLAALTLLSLSACHGSRAEKKSGELTETEAALTAEELSELVEIPARFDDTKPIEISFWAKNDTNQVQIAIYRQAVEDFQQLYPNVRVKLKFYTDYARIYNDVITNIATKTTPNVCISYPDHIATYLTGENVVVPLDGLMADEKYGLGGSELRFNSPRQDEIVPQFLRECMLSGRYYALPFMRSTEACYINKSYVEKLGYTVPEMLTWDFVWEVSEAAMEKDAAGNFKVNGQSVMIPFIYKSTDNMMIQALRQLGAGYSTDSGEVLLFNDETRQFLLEISRHVSSGAFDTFKRVGYPANFLDRGQCIFAIDSTAGATWMGSRAPVQHDIPEEDKVDFEIAVRPIPQFDVEHPQMISQGPSVCIFQKSDPQEVLASWLFLQFLVSNAVQLPYARTEGYVPVTYKAQNDPAYLDYLARVGEDDEHYEVKIQASELLMANTENTFTTPVFNGSASVRDAAGELIESVTSDVRRGKTVNDSYISALYRRVISLKRLERAETEGPLPAGAVVLLGGLGGVWMLLGVSWLSGRIKKKRTEKTVKT